MSDAFPASILCLPSGGYVDVVAPDVAREAFNGRPSTGGVYDYLPSVGLGAAGRQVQRPFLNGTTVDLTSDGSTTPQVYKVAPTTGTWLISGIGLEMITSNNLVFNGAAFGGQFYSAGGLLGLGAGYFSPSALSKGLQLTVTQAGVTTAVTNLQVNEDFAAAQNPPIGGSVTGTAKRLICRYETKQTLSAASSDAMAWTVRDNLNNNQGIVELRAYAWGQILA